MKTFLVNLDRNPERLAFMDEQLKRLGIDYERIPAVDGRKLSGKERRKKFARFHSFFAMNRFMSPGEIGCALSHIAVYQLMRARNVECALVLEDDVVLSDQFRLVLDRAIKFVDVQKPQVVLFSCWGASANEGGDERIEPSPKSFWCTDAYLITLPAAKIVERENFPVVTVADRWHRWEHSLGLELYRIFPTTVEQDRAQFSTVVDQNNTRPILLRVYMRLLGRWLNPIVDRYVFKMK